MQHIQRMQHTHHAHLPPPQRTTSDCLIQSHHEYRPWRMTAPRRAPEEDPEVDAPFS